MFRTRVVEASETAGDRTAIEGDLVGRRVRAGPQIEVVGPVSTKIA